MKQLSYIVGIDEAGRGPLAGPVAVGVVIVPKGFNWKLLPGVGDSKKISPNKRALIKNAAEDLKRQGKLDFEVKLSSASFIDRKGIVPAITTALEAGLEQVMKRQSLATSQVAVKLDGGLRAPKEYVKQETIIKGDEKELVIGLASILAKETRDEYMLKIAKKKAFLPYQFALHKGYGTSLHLAAIAEFGPSSEHRRSFCRNIFEKLGTKLP